MRTRSLNELKRSPFSSLTSATQVRLKSFQLGTARDMQNEPTPGDSGTWDWKRRLAVNGQIVLASYQPHKLNRVGLVQYADGERADSCFY